MKTTAASVAVMLLADVFPGKVAAQDAETKVPVATFARKRIARLSELSEATPIEFNFPSAAIHTNCMLFKLGKAAGGGVGDDDDIVAFSARCTHMGGDLSRGYIKDHQLVGCGEHLTTFDLTRHGIMVAGHATDRLPQILLEIEGDEIFATGIVGLLYGYAANPISQHSKSEAE
jgi:arsenite oxidase small subunit